MYRYSLDPTLDRLLLEAVSHERTCARVYQLIAEQAPTPDEQSRLASIRRDEGRHHLTLVGIYEELTGIWDEGGPASASLPTDYVEMLKTAICDELSGAVMYEQLIAQLNCARQKELVCQIMNDEKHHARILASIYEKHAQRQRPRYQEPYSWRNYDYRPYKY